MVQGSEKKCAYHFLSEVFSPLSGKSMYIYIFGVLLIHFCTACALLASATACSFISGVGTLSYVYISYVRPKFTGLGGGVGSHA